MDDKPVVPDIKSCSVKNSCRPEQAHLSCGRRRDAHAIQKGTTAFDSSVELVEHSVVHNTHNGYTIHLLIVKDNRA